MIPNLNMGFYQREYLVKPCSIQTSDKKKSVEGFELFASKTYSILSYVVGGFVGSKSQMNNNKHNLSYDLSAAVFNLLNPCKHERGLRKSGESLYNAPPKITSEGYDKYIVKASQKALGLELYVMGFEDPCYPSSVDRETQSMDVTDQVGNTEMSGVGVERLRQQSECSITSTDSESFIVFDSTEQEEEEGKSDGGWKLEDFDFGSDEEEDECCDDIDIYSLDKELADANDKWKKNYANVDTPDHEGHRKVRFNDDVKINKIVAWNYAYRAARLGPWEQMARDRVRFRERILRLSATISPVLENEHRDKIYKQLYS